jgi:site-specific recombinase XerD
VYEFLFYVTRQRANMAASRARKLSSLRGFFKYLTGKPGQLTQNPVDDIERPAQKKRLPKYLSLEESLQLLGSIESDYYERDYCIITLFLNCGMRLSELVSLNVSDVKADTLRVVGKGNKERMVYLNQACLQTLGALLASRNKITNLRDKNAIFVSKKTGGRLCARRVQQIVNRCLASAGLDGKGYSVHKLRHTAATLLYRHGHVDLLSLKEILGHADVSTTEIYTHLDSAQLKEAAQASPLAKVKPPTAPPNFKKQ